MPAKLRNTWENLQASLWFVPTVMVVLASLLSMVLVTIDRRLSVRVDRFSLWLVGGTADAAQTLLAVVAGSLITVVSIAYSITIIAIQQTSVQFSPRVLRTFTSDRGNQIVLGGYVATFIYALLVMRQIRNTSDPDTSFVPVVAVAAALILAFSCLGLLIYFIHHISQLLQVSVIIDHVHRELVEEVDHLYPQHLGLELADVPPVDEAGTFPIHRDDIGYVRATTEGFLRIVDGEVLFAASDGKTPWLAVRPQVGDYVPHNCVLAAFTRDARLTDADLALLRDAFVLDVERTIAQDPLFGIRQLVDIALKALSPAINDPTTAEYCLSHLGDALSRLCRRPFPSNQRLGPGGSTRYLFSRPTWDDFVEAAFGQIRRQAADNVHVTAYLLRVLHEIALCFPPAGRGQAIQQQVDEVRYTLRKDLFSPSDRALLARQAEAVEQALALAGQRAQMPQELAQGVERHI